MFSPVCKPSNQQQTYSTQASLVKPCSHIVLLAVITNLHILCIIHCTVNSQIQMLVLCVCSAQAVDAMRHALQYIYWFN